MDHPTEQDLPFFAYGLFQPGQIAYFQLRDCVRTVETPASVRGRLLIRDGLPLLDPEGEGTVKGSLLRFRDGAASKAYDRISSLEPSKQYCWGTAKVNTTPANVLLGKSPTKGSAPLEGLTWDGWNDPLFTAALDVVEETVESNAEFQMNLKPMFRLQMSYLLLWSAIERYVSLRYHLAHRATEKVKHLGEERAFASAVRAHVSAKREVVRTDRPQHKEVLDPDSPESAVRYYYQVRSNITHRGKGVFKDHDILFMSATELLRIFRSVLSAAKSEANLET